MKPSRILPLLALPLFAYGEDQTVSVSENDLNKSVTFESPTTVNDTKNRIIINNASSVYTMDTISVSPDDDNDKESWKCIISTGSGMTWKIVALKKTPLTYTIGGGLTKVLAGGGGGGAPDKKAFTVAVPAETMVSWSNLDGSHEDPAAIQRLKIAAGEKVTFKIKNSHLGNPTWSATGGWFNITGGSTFINPLAHEAEVTWTAPQTKGTATVTATFPHAGTVGGMNRKSGTEVTLTFDVILPASATVARQKQLGGSEVPDDLISNLSDLADPTSLRVGVRLYLHYTATPRDVNFKYTHMAEDNSPGAVKPYGVTGYFADLLADTHAPGYHDLIHKPTLPWTPCDEKGSWDDVAAFPDATSLLSTLGDRIWKNGAYYWAIPVHFQGKDPRTKSLTRTVGAGTHQFDLRQTTTVTSSPNPATSGAGTVVVSLKHEKSRGFTGATVPAGTIENTATGTITL